VYQWIFDIDGFPRMNHTLADAMSAIDKIVEAMPAHAETNMRGWYGKQVIVDGKFSTVEITREEWKAITGKGQ
jgi:hypothetical protein